MTKDEERSKLHRKILGDVRKSNRRNKFLLSILHYDWPISEIAIANICEYIELNKGKNDEYDIGGVCAESVIYGLMKYSEALFYEDKVKLDDPMRYSIFVSSIITRLLEVTNKNTRDVVVREKLYSSTTTMKIKNTLKRLGYEEAIITGDLDIVN